MVDWARVLGVGTMLVVSLLFAVLVWWLIPYELGVLLAARFDLVAPTPGWQAVYCWCLGLGPAIWGYAGTCLLFYWTSDLRWKRAGTPIGTSKG